MASDREVRATIKDLHYNIRLAYQTNGLSDRDALVFAMIEAGLKKVYVSGYKRGLQDHEDAVRLTKNHLMEQFINDIDPPKKS